MLPSKCLHNLPAWSKPPFSLTWTTAVAWFFPTVYPPQAAGGGGEIYLSAGDICHSKPSGGSISLRVKAKYLPRACTIQPRVSLLTSLLILLLPRWPPHCFSGLSGTLDLRTFALAVTLFWNDPPLNIHMAHSLTSYTYLLKLTSQ